VLKLLWEWWVQVWPNLAASVLTFSGGFVWARRSLLVKLEQRELSHLQRHKELRLMIEKLISVQASAIEDACGHTANGLTVTTGKGTNRDDLRT